MSEFGFYREDNDKNRLHQILGWLIDIVAVVTLAVFLVTQFANPRVVNGRSMEPSLKSGDNILVHTISPRILPLHRDDIVLFHPASGVERNSIKRIVGLPGETVQIYQGAVYINGQVLTDLPFAMSVSTPGVAENPVLLGADEYFLLGDNGSNSEDSRFANIGNVESSQIYGRVWFCYAPLEEFGFVR